MFDFSFDSDDDEFDEEIREFVRNIDYRNDIDFPVLNNYASYWEIESQIIKFRKEIDNYNDSILDNKEEDS